MINWDLWGVGEDGPDYCQSLYELAQKFECKKGLEIGVRFGKSALAFLMAVPKSTLIGIDPNPEFEVENFLARQGVGKRFTFYREASPEALERFGGKPQFDWIYIDGDHRYDAINADYEATWPLLKKGGIMVFDDYREDLGYSTGTQAWFHDKGFKHVSTKDLGLTENPHACAILIKE